MNPVAVRSRARRAAEKAAGKQQTAAAPIIAAEEETPAEGLLGALEVEVQEPAPRPAMSFKDRMLAKFKDAPAGAAEKKKPAAKKGKKVEINFLTQALPIISGLLASNAEKWFSDEYKDCAPQRAEVVAILAPLFSIAERRIKVSTEMSEDTVDLIACGTAALGMAGRIYVTHSDIKQLRKGNHAEAQAKQSTAASSSSERAARTAASNYDGASNDPAAREAAILAQFGRSAGSEAAVSGYDGHLDFQPGRDFDGLQAQDDAIERGGDTATYDGSNRSWELATVAKAFSRDFSYRSQNGLL